MIMVYFKDADVILERGEIKLYVFIDRQISVLSRPFEQSESYVLFATEAQLGQDINECLCDGFSVEKGVEHVNRFQEANP